MTQLLFNLALIAWLAGAALGLASARARTSFLLGISGSLLLTCAAVAALSTGGVTLWNLPCGIPLFTFTLRLNALAAYFNLALGILGAAVSLYSIGYRCTGLLAFFYNILLLSLALVFAAGNVFLFLTAWELMALSSWCLITFDHEKPETRSAAMLFLIMSHAGTGLLLIAFLILARSAGSIDFSAFHLLASKLPPAEQAAVFLLFFAGFGVKAGIIPLHVWLPAAHPVAPSNISALMSGIVIKTGIYGMALVFFDFFGTPPVWIGMVVLGIGVVSAVLGVLYALMEHDLKRLLAYHSIENIGIILIGFGAALVFRALGHPNLAAVALIAGLYHTLNHAIFKCLLFLGAGAVLHATGTRNMEEMGGLIRRMPATALYFLIGAVAIAGLPPLNGFVSEWLTYQALLAGFGSTQTLTRLVFPIAGALLALTAALAAACFVKAFGISFLGLPRSTQAGGAQEAGWEMRTAMGVLAAGCVALGLGATCFLPVFDPVTAQTLGTTASAVLTGGNGFLVTSGSSRGGTVSPAGIAFLLVLLSGLPALFWMIWERAGKRATGPTWDCGLPGLTAENQYTATGFSKPIRMIFSTLYRPRREISSDFDVSPYYPTAIRFESEVEPTFEKHVYDPLRDWLFRVARRMRTVQAGSVHAYLAYIFLTLIALLLFGARG